MINEYLEEQEKAVKILTKSILSNKYSHAYLFETNGYKKKIEFSLAVAKMLLCPNKYVNSDQCLDCKQCSNIDKGLFTEIKVIEPDGLWIKKEQLNDLQKEFNKKSLSTTNKVYIINNADRLNKQAANSILKFLEEPVPNVIAILITDNIYQLLDTIISRCQVITFSRIDKNLQTDVIHNVKKNINVSIEDELLIDKINKTLDFICYYESNKIDTLLETQKLWHSFTKEKAELLLSLDLMIFIYKDALNHKLNRPIVIFNEYKEKLVNISNRNSVNELYNKIKVIIKNKYNINYNVNSGLLIDKIILELERCDIND